MSRDIAVAISGPPQTATNGTPTTHFHRPPSRSTSTVAASPPTPRASSVHGSPPRHSVLRQRRQPAQTWDWALECLSWIVTAVSWSEAPGDVKEGGPQHFFELTIVGSSETVNRNTPP